MADFREHILNTYKARDMIVAEIGQAVPGTDLIEVLAYALSGDLEDEVTLEEVKQTVFTVARQRIGLE